MALRSMRMAASKVVPDPANGASTVAGTISASCLQDGRQLSVARVVGCQPVLSVLVGLFRGTCAGSRPLMWPVRSTTRTQGAPQAAQTPLADVPRLMHRRGSSLGKVAKGASRKGSGG